jgi:hypothetical protein
MPASGIKSLFIMVIFLQTTIRGETHRGDLEEVGRIISRDVFDYLLPLSVSELTESKRDE